MNDLFLNEGANRDFNRQIFGDGAINLSLEGHQVASEPRKKGDKKEISDAMKRFWLGSDAVVAK